MDEQALNELLECSVCLDQLDDTSKVLPCQHTFCKRCLEEIVSTKHELRCPECRFHVEMRVEDLPSNILLIRLLEGLKSQSRIASSQGPGHRRETLGSPGSSKADNTNQAVAAFARQQQQRQASTSNRPCAKALFNYDAKDPGDLSFKKGDIVYLKKQVDENWFHGELNGQHGFFPVNYVQVITALQDTIPQCKGLYDFTVDDDKEEDCMPFKKDDTMTVIRRVDENWLEVKKGDKIGILPISFVELNDPAKRLLSLTDKNAIAIAGSDPPVTPAHPVRSAKEGSPGAVPVVNKRHSLTTIPLTVTTPASALQRRSLDSNTDTDLLATGGQSVAIAAPLLSTMTTEMPVTMTTQPKIPANQAISVPPRKTETELPLVPSQNKPDSTVILDQPAVTSRHTGDVMSASLTAGRKEDVASGSIGSSASIYIALYNYKPQKGDELELIKGDYYSVSEKCLDGWYKGVALKTNLSGVFPGNYVQSVKTHTSTSKSSSKSLVTKPKLPPPDQGLNAATKPSLSPPRPKTSSSEAAGRSRARPDRERRSASGDRNGAPPPIVPRSGQNLAPSSGKGHVSPSPNSPILLTSKTTRYVRAPKSSSPSLGAKSDTSPNTSASSPVWKHSMSASANITPPNVVVGASANHAPAVVKEKEKKKDKEKLSLMKRITSAGKLKKPKSTDVESASLSDSSVSHSRSGSYPSDTSPLVPLEPNHKKSGSFDSSSPNTQRRPTRPKPLAREKYRCIDTYPAQSEIELDLKIGDVIYVHKKRDDGWFKGTLQRSGKTGLFPGTFVVKVS
ncbi:E3 ubiquitin-protein ligase SH3RF1-like [Mercenaria mercenaria]|uniref:E3 ubiquitin-protein ligase SH3RF1-like n=1 Tax=Mercenaria mercenaria TaxID=6596 RepID=UPI00234EB8CC|nr:E3 ubiquitin-protein ligase SH3RF1-like [Mercenaria mercenaria]XP_053398497.1 E3 ubiquitin-protein ligase SH3RF1-like [Mercenaria mercenaria]XP_053398498.1 E3 ubiquitin-protein ligase SH3RF1-like [Mercenaria mercenaria]